MPNCGSQVILCDLPIRFDTYKGCSHGCKYCFASRNHDLHKIEFGESAASLAGFISGKRTQLTSWCDWNIPIHWGGMSDPFQPCEKKYKRSLQCLKVFKETQYPFVVSTKGILPIDPEYLKLLKECNCVIQVSMACKEYDKIEPGCPSFDERLNMVRILSRNCKRVIIRIQPYMHEVLPSVKNNIRLFAEAGAHGVIIEGMKFQKKKPGLVRVGSDHTYAYELIKSDFLTLQEEAHKYGIKCYAGENRIRALGDSMCCCGIDDLPGFVGNVYNLAHIVNGDKVTATKTMKKIGTAQCFKALDQTSSGSKLLDTMSFEDMMYYTLDNKKKFTNDIFAIDKK